MQSLALNEKHPMPKRRQITPSLGLVRNRQIIRYKPAGIHIKTVRDLSTNARVLEISNRMRRSIMVVLSGIYHSPKNNTASVRL